MEYSKFRKESRLFLNLTLASPTDYNNKLVSFKGGPMSRAARVLGGSLASLLTLGRVGMAQQASAYQLSGQEMIFLLLLVACVIGGWVGYEWIHRGRTS